MYSHMLLNDYETIYPCPFSKGYGIPSQQAWLFLKIFLFYRVFLASLLILLYQSPFSEILISTKHLQLYNATSLVYLILGLVFIFFAFWRVGPYSLNAQSIIFIDIIVITLIMHSCGGISSGFGILLAGSLAASGLLIGGRCSIVFAAIATIFIFSEQIYSIHLGKGLVRSYPTVGMLGATFFITAFLSYVLAQRSEQSAALANKQQQKIVTLEALNKYVIQHLQSGVIIINPKQQILSINETALDLFQAQSSLELADISAPLALLFDSWQRNPRQDFFTLQSPQKANLHLRFNLLMTENQAFYMIMLEDVALHNQRLQQGVLASLGRLTASIAHEIRNPLSAITHAAQLLSENLELNPQDIRLTEIIIEHSGRVNKIITDILKSSKRTPSNRKELRLNIFLNTYLHDFLAEQAINETYLHLELCDINLETRIDVGHLQQIMDNLCHNAIKYGSPEKGGVIIRLSHLKTTPIIDVIDNGKLLDSDTITHLFEPFFTTSTTGTGLGLYLSRELAELNQASLTYRVNNLKNNSFRLQLSNAKNTKIEL